MAKVTGKAIATGKPPNSKFVQIAIYGSIYGLDATGRVWKYTEADAGWVALTTKRHPPRSE